jgi:hypothetical protein
MEYFDEINCAKSLFLLKIEEPQDNQVVITVQETTRSETEEYVKVGDKVIGPVRAIITDESCKKYNLLFRSYVSYTVMNESFPLFHDYEEYIGKLLRIYSKSNYLDYVRKDTSAKEFFEYLNEELRHFSINCENHVIHVMTTVVPIINKI